MKMISVHMKYGKKYLKIRLSDDRTFQTFARNNEDNREE